MRRGNREKDGRTRLKQAKRKKCAERRVNKIFRKPRARGVWSWMPEVSAPSGGLEPPSQGKRIRREWAEESGVENRPGARGLGGVESSTG
jgi:hypothetical protein